MAFLIKLGGREYERRRPAELSPGVLCSQVSARKASQTTRPECAETGECLELLGLVNSSL